MNDEQKKHKWCIVGAHGGRDEMQVSKAIQVYACVHVCRGSNHVKPRRLWDFWASNIWQLTTHEQSWSLLSKLFRFFIKSIILAIFIHNAPLDALGGFKGELFCGMGRNKGSKRWQEEGAKTKGDGPHRCILIEHLLEEIFLFLVSILCVIFLLLLCYTSTNKLSDLLIMPHFSPKPNFGSDAADFGNQAATVYELKYRKCHKLRSWDCTFMIYVCKFLEYWVKYVLASILKRVWVHSKI